MSKNELRKQLRATRNKLPPAYREQCALQLCKTFYRQLDLISMKRVGVYLHADSEISLDPLIHMQWQQHHRTYLPALHPFRNGQLLFAEYKQGKTLTHNRYNILEPDMNRQSAISLLSLDAILMPLVGYDMHASRLGMGGGYYDKTLAQTVCHCPSRPKLIGVAYNEQQCERIESEPWDIKLNAILTPDFYHRF